MPFVSIPRDVPERVFKGHNDYGGDDNSLASDQSYAQGYKDAVRQILGDDAWFALICKLDGNDLPQLVVRQ